MLEWLTDPKPVAIKFSLRTLFVVIARVAVACALMRWLGAPGFIISLCAIGVEAIVAGIVKHRFKYIAGGFGIIIASFALGPLLLNKVAWVGHQKISFAVHVYVRSGAPIPNAVLLLTSDAGISTALTDSSGGGRLTGEFTVCGTDDLFKKTDDIETHGKQLTVKATGFRVFESQLDELIPSDWDLYASSQRDVRVKLDPLASSRLSPVR